jgi:hypothetical protein
MASSASAQRPLSCRASVTDLVGWVALAFRSRQSLDAEILFLRRQLALYVERGVKPRRIDAATRVSLALLSRLFAWRSALVVVRPQTLIRWYRAGFRLLWRWKSRPGRPPIPAELRQLIRRMALENPVWGQERIANELLVKLGLHVSPRTVRKYLPKPPAGQPRGGLTHSALGSRSAACPETLGRALQPRPPPHDARPWSARPSGGQSNRDAEVLPPPRELRLSA